MNKTIISTGAILGALAVILGAMGAHALASVLTPESLSSFQTGVQYQMYHAVFLLFLGGFRDLNVRYRIQIFRIILAGVCCFSGSIYLLTTSELTGINFKSFGWITPIGGLFLISGWILLILRTLRNKETS